MRLKLTYLIAFFFLIVSCKKKEQSDYRNLNYSELFSYFISSQDTFQPDSIVERLYDSILLYSNHYLESYEIMDSNRNEMKLQFFHVDENYFDYCIKERNVFLFEINQYDSIKAKGNLIENLGFIENDIYEFILNPKEKPDLPEKRLKVIEYFDTAYVSKGVFWIYALTVPDSLGNKSSLIEIKKIVNLIQETTDSIRNEVSIRKWNQEYNKLKLNQKVALSELIPIAIWIFPNRKILPPPPPPPPRMESTKSIEELSEKMTDLILQQKEKE